MNKFFSIVFMLGFALVACAQDNTAPDNPTINEEPRIDNTNDSNEENNEITEKIDELPFNKFELDVDYDDKFDVEVELERNPSGNIDVEYRDERKGVDERGGEAFHLLYDKLKNLDIDQNLTDDEVIANVLQTFELNRDYTELDLVIVFNDGTRREYIDEKK